MTTRTMITMIKFIQFALLLNVAICLPNKQQESRSASYSKVDNGAIISELSSSSSSSSSIINDITLPSVSSPLNTDEVSSSSLPSSKSTTAKIKLSSSSSSSSSSSTTTSIPETKSKASAVTSQNLKNINNDKKVNDEKDKNAFKETRESLGKIRPKIKLTTNYTSASETGVRLPEGASAALAKPTKYHYYPHNQHIYLLPECAVQQVCNAVYVRLNFTQPLCACPGRYRDPCSASLDSDDHHTTELVTDPRTKALTLVKTCEPVADMRECRAPKDWSLLALQNVRTGKSHYLVICRCPDTNILEGPMSHDQPMYASVPGIRVYGMMCVQGNRRARPLRYNRSILDLVETARYPKPSFPWHKVPELMKMAIEG